MSTLRIGKTKTTAEIVVCRSRLDPCILKPGSSMEDRQSRILSTTRFLETLNVSMLLENGARGRSLLRNVVILSPGLFGVCTGAVKTPQQQSRFYVLNT